MLEFGLLRNHDSSGGTMEWAAPELLRNEDYSTPADVYSLAYVLLTELDTRLIPYTDVRQQSTVNDDTLMMQIVTGALRPTVLPTCPRPIQKLIQSCLAVNPAQRPRMEDVVAILEQEKLIDNGLVRTTLAQMMHTRRLVGALAGVAGAGYMSFSPWWLESDEPEKDKVVLAARPRTFETVDPRQATAGSRQYGLEQKSVPRLGRSCSVCDSRGVPGVYELGHPRHLVAPAPYEVALNSTMITSKQAQATIDSSNFSLLLNVVAGDTRNSLPDATSHRERATRYGKKAHPSSRERHDMDPRLGDALRALTVLNGTECQFGPANLSSLVTLACTPNLPQPYAEFAWWALAASASNKSLTPRYRWRKEWLGDDRVARTRSILMKNPYIWSALLTTAVLAALLKSSSKLLASSRKCARVDCPSTTTDALISSSTGLRQIRFQYAPKRFQILTQVAAHESGRTKLASRGTLDFLHHKLEANDDARLTALLLGTVHALAFGASLDERSLSSVTSDADVNMHHEDWLADMDEPTYVRGWIDLLTSFVAHDDADVAANAVACLDALSTHGMYRKPRNARMGHRHSRRRLGDCSGGSPSPSELCPSCEESNSTAQVGASKYPTAYLKAHTRALRALGFALDRPESHAAFIRAGGLPLLRAMLQSLDDASYPREAVTALQVEWARVVANLVSTSKKHAELQDPFWTTQLTRLATSSNLQVKTHATRGLHNLHRTKDAATYMEGVHPFTLDSSAPFDVDVVFVHGLLGCPSHEPRVVSLGYDSKLFASESSFATLGLDATSEDLRIKLKRAGVGVDRPVVFVAHSMGGIVVKKMLHDDAMSSEAATLAVNTKGLVFYGVPHKGSPVAAAIFPVAAAVQRQGIHLQHPVTADLHGTPRLDELNAWCAKFAKDKAVRVVSIGESTPVKLPLVGVEALVVPAASSNPGFGEYVQLPATDHIQVCKPASIADARNGLVSWRALRRHGRPPNDKEDGHHTGLNTNPKRSSNGLQTKNTTVAGAATQTATRKRKYRAMVFGGGCYNRGLGKEINQNDVRELHDNGIVGAIDDGEFGPIGWLVDE
ncbi:hypothetical protein Ae201684P_009584 [Aphanomyces euteiches]|nr:hypothetical protein Ae201684P_009584 [Aphanomyces euteiches]